MSGAVVIAHSMGCLVALTLTLTNPELVSKLILLGPPLCPVPESVRTGSVARAAVVRASGMADVLDAVVAAGTSSKSKSDNPLAIAAVRMSLLGQDPEGYAKDCTALAAVSQPVPVNLIKAPTLIITGSDDKVSPPQVREELASQMEGAEFKELPSVGHWHLFEDVKGVSAAIESFL